MNYVSDTIAAISTSAMANSGIGIIRMSGTDAVGIADKIFIPKKTGKTLEKSDSHTIHYGNIADGDEIIDEVLVMLMKAPNTYTKEDVVEINCHGGILVMQKILEVCFKYGARPAEPGEFTKRAFLNGRIDLSQAEAVIDIINSKNDFALKSSVNQLSGKLSQVIKSMREEIINSIAYIEAALDDPEHISLDNYGEKMGDIVDKLVDNLSSLWKTADNGHILREGINTVILGKPNAGKSSLLNTLARYERAIVTDVAGTTRDILEEQINLSGITLNLIDTAGIRDTEDIVEKIGVDKAKKYALEADLVIYVVDSSKKLDEDDNKILELIKDKKTIILLNKSDLQQVVTDKEIENIIQCPIISISAKKDIGIDILEETIKNLFISGEVRYNDEVYITNLRQKNALKEAEKSLKLVRNSIDEGLPEDFYTIDLMNAYEELGKIIGESVEDDLVNEIFSKFCMGK